MTHIAVVCIFISDIGFEVPDAFLVGYALDYNEYFRDLSVSLQDLITPDEIRHFVKHLLCPNSRPLLIVYSMVYILILIVYFQSWHTKYQWILY